MKVIMEFIIRGVIALLLKKRGVARKQGTNMTKCFTSKIEGQDD
jgi:hypothetical protein